MKFRFFDWRVLVAALAALTFATPALAEKGKLRERPCGQEPGPQAVGGEGERHRRQRQREQYQWINHQ